jgi:hypothetical protein
MIVRLAIAWTAVALLLVGLSAIRAFDRDEALVTVHVSASDHEMLEGYFSLGDDATLMVKPGSNLYRFLAGQRGQKVKILITPATPAATPELSRLER